MTTSWHGNGSRFTGYAVLWCFRPEESVEQTFELPVTWEAVTLMCHYAFLWLVWHYVIHITDDVTLNQWPSMKFEFLLGNYVFCSLPRTLMLAYVKISRKAVCLCYIGCVINTGKIIFLLAFFVAEPVVSRKGGRYDDPAPSTRTINTRNQAAGKTRTLGFGTL